ncbi:hypothetical protein BCR42DRAFT_396691 [Absidia repens]|uniref:Uncharacterized protein n=1 Tax=Absidia repens TaxID=90262 RepID=A0A1X2I3Z7_9FUNG|nr:hypothetical protein BCR42DRAFT_396691 [Absidia repens]
MTNSYWCLIGFIIDTCRKWKKTPTDNDNDKVPVFVWEDVKFGRNGKGAGHLADACRQHLLNAEKSEKLVGINMGDYMTYQVCSDCGHRSLSNEVICGPGQHAKRMYPVSVCNHCNTVCQRNINTSTISVFCSTTLPPLDGDLDFWKDQQPTNDLHNKYALMFTV